jgi:hypothetical protein
MMNDRGVNFHLPPKHSVSPHISCTCGIYALSEYPRLWEVREGRRRPTLKPWPFEAVNGMVKGWGKVIVGSKGFRAQYVEPIALIARPRGGGWPPGIERLAETYGIEVVSVPRRKP